MARLRESRNIHHVEFKRVDVCKPLKDVKNLPQSRGDVLANHAHFTSEREQRTHKKVDNLRYSGTERTLPDRQASEIRNGVSSKTLLAFLVGSAREMP